jgi:hypothetical protein
MDRRRFLLLTWFTGLFGSAAVKLLPELPELEAEATEISESTYDGLFQLYQRGHVSIEHILELFHIQGT